MNRKNMIVLAFIIFAGLVNAQDKFMTKIGHIRFYSHAKVEDIEANNNEVTSIINIKSGEMAFVVLMKSFKFKNALMEEHFNENYMETDKFPRAKFKGKVSNISSVDLTKDGLYNVDVEGDLEIHGITKHLTEKGTLEVKDGKIAGLSKFTIAIKDYGIAIESSLSDHIAENVEVSVEMSYELMKQ